MVGHEDRDEFKMWAKRQKPPCFVNEMKSLEATMLALFCESTDIFGKKSHQIQKAQTVLIPEEVSVNRLYKPLMGQGPDSMSSEQMSKKVMSEVFQQNILESELQPKC